MDPTLSWLPPVLELWTRSWTNVVRRKHWSRLVDSRRARLHRAALQQLGLLAGEVRPSLEDHIAVERVQLHDKGAAAGLLGGDQGRAAAAKQIQDILARLRGVL